jgi:hypothetical protein
MGQKKRVEGVIIGKTVNLSIDGVMDRKVCKTEALAKKLFKQVLKAKEDPTDENIRMIHGFLNEKTRMMMECGLETDVNSGNAYLAGFNTPIPFTLVDVIKDYHDNKYPMESVINFWKLLMLNPDERVRLSLFDFIKEHDFVLTDTGYMIVYKAVARREEGNTEDGRIAEFVATKALFVKTKWSCSPKKYIVYRDKNDNLSITKQVTAKNWNENEKGVKILGNLGEMFQKISHFVTNDESSPYTDKHTKKMMIKLGEPIIMDRKKCDSDPAIECSFGLHVGATKYVESFGNSGDAILVCYVNPAHVIAVPNYDRTKIRVSEYFPFAIASFEDNKIDIIEQSYFESDYTHYEQEELAKMVEAIHKNEKPIELDSKLKKIEETRSLDELKKIIEYRLIDLTETK